MTAIDTPPEGYRACVGIVLFSPRGLVFAGRRIDTAQPAWQLPQGGLEPGEGPRQAGLRELAEEIGTNRAAIVDEIAGWLTYELPDDVARRAWGGRYRGQAQKWLLARFTGSDDDIDIGAHGAPEFDAWCWMDLAEITGQIVPFKRAIYDRLVEAFAGRIVRETG